VYFDMLNFPVHHSALGEALDPEFLRRTVAYSPQREIRRVLAECPYTDPLDRVMYVDAKTYLPGLLVMEDKLSMAHSLEARVPLLDNELVDFVSGLPWNLLFDGASGKLVFRESVRPWVPDAIYRKPKMGFGPPDASWYRRALRPFIEDYLSPQRVARRGIFRPGFVGRILDEHFSEQANHVATIWSLLSLEAWCRTFGMMGGRL
jgi:asparagine synthase (glutamine-hydrolysing)